jgi:hypothetical protein
MYYDYGRYLLLYKEELSLNEGRYLENISINEFKRVWEESMKGSLNSPSSITMDEQMRSVEVELGPDFKKSCVVACENSRPIGVVIPHIEPGTLREGRLFYFGLIPEERGKGKSIPLHQQALDILKNVFKAEYYKGPQVEIMFQC